MGRLVPLTTRVRENTSNTGASIGLQHVCQTDSCSKTCTNVLGAASERVCMLLSPASAFVTTDFHFISVVYEHKSRLEKTLQQEKQDHRKSKNGE